MLGLSPPQKIHYLSEFSFWKLSSFLLNQENIFLFLLLFLYHDNVSPQVTHQPPQLAGVLCGSAGILFICVILYSRRKASSTTTPIFLKKKHNQHYKISQFYRRKNSVGVWLEVRRWFFYRRPHRQITSVGFPFVGDSPFRRYIGWKNIKTICRWFYRRNLRAKKKKIPAWNIPTDF
jgi:hypothetical protein